MAASGNSALRPQIGVTNVESVIDTHDVDLTGGTGQNKVSLIPTGDGTWTKFTSNVQATLALACEDAGYILCKLEFTAGNQTDVRIPCFLTD